MNSHDSPRSKTLFRGTQILWYVLGLLEVLLAFRFILKLLGANGGATFTDLIYRFSEPFVYPFAAVFNATFLSGTIFEWTTLLAMLVYWVIALAIIRIFVMSRRISAPEAASRLNRQDSV